MALAACCAAHKSLLACRARGGRRRHSPSLARGAAVLPALPPLARTSLLVVSPHPDDETLCCAG